MLLYLHLSIDCFMKISLHTFLPRRSEEKSSWNSIWTNADKINFCNLSRCHNRLVFMKRYMDLHIPVFFLVRVVYHSNWHYRLYSYYSIVCLIMWRKTYMYSIAEHFYLIILMEKLIPGCRVQESHIICASDLFHTSYIAYLWTRYAF